MDLYNPLIFCNDSVLRMKNYHNDKVILYPFLDIQHFLKEDPIVILKLFRQPVNLEQGTTLANIILALEPWAKIISNYTDRDVQAYCDACRKLGGIEQEFSFIEISKGLYNNRHYNHLPRKEGEGLSEWLNRDDSHMKTSFFDLENSLSMCGFMEGDDSNYSMSVDFNKIRNTPVFIANKQHNIFSHGRSKEILLNQDIDGVKTYSNHSLFYSEAELSFEELITAVFIDGLFYEKPMSDEDNEAFIAQLDSSMREAKEADYEDIDEISNVSPIRKDEEDLTIEIAPGAFDPLIAHEKEKVSDWETLYHSISHTASIKIGDPELSLREHSYRFFKDENK